MGVRGSVLLYIVLFWVSAKMFLARSTVLSAHL